MLGVIAGAITGVLVSILFLNIVGYRACFGNETCMGLMLYNLPLIILIGGIVGIPVGVFSALHLADRFAERRYRQK